MANIKKEIRKAIKIKARVYYATHCLVPIEDFVQMKLSLMKIRRAIWRGVNYQKENNKQVKIKIIYADTKANLKRVRQALGKMYKSKGRV
jgi:hypothetical protein